MGIDDLGLLLLIVIWFMRPTLMHFELSDQTKLLRRIADSLEEQNDLLRKEKNHDRL